MYLDKATSADTKDASGNPTTYFDVDFTTPTTTPIQEGDTVYRVIHTGSCFITPAHTVLLASHVQILETLSYDFNYVIFKKQTAAVKVPITAIKKEFGSSGGDVSILNIEVVKVDYSIKQPPAGKG